MFVGAALLVLGALINAVGIRNDAARRQEEPETKAAAPHAEAATE
jgi:hypothetical protein